MFAVLLIGVRTDLLGFVQGVTKCMEQGVFFGKLVGPRSVKDCPPPPIQWNPMFYYCAHSSPPSAWVCPDPDPRNPRQPNLFP